MTTRATQPRLLLIDDDAELAALMTEFFGRHDMHLVTAPDGRAGLDLALQGAFDIVLLDVMLPGLDGLEVLRQLRAASNVPVVMLTARGDAPSRISGLEAGADDYLPKPFDPLELLARARAVLRRSTQANPAEALEWRVGGVRADSGSRAVWENGRRVELTSIEYEILEALISAAGRIVSRDDLSQRLYGRSATPYERAIDVHVSHVRRKLGAAGALIQTVRGAGYLFALSLPDGEDA